MLIRIQAFHKEFTENAANKNEVKIDPVIYISDSIDSQYIVGNPKLKMEMGKAGAMTFIIFPNHPHYQYFKPLVSFIEVYFDYYSVFRGRVAQIKQDFLKRKHITIDGDLSYLKDIMAYPTDTQVLPFGQYSVFSNTSDSPLPGQTGNNPDRILFKKTQDSEPSYGSYPYLGGYASAYPEGCGSSDFDNGKVFFGWKTLGHNGYTMHRNKCALLWFLSQYEYGLDKGAYFRSKYPNNKTKASTISYRKSIYPGYSFVGETLIQQGKYWQLLNKNYRTIAQAFQNDLIKMCGGYLKTRKQDGFVKLDYVTKQNYWSIPVYDKSSYKMVVTSDNSIAYSDKNDGQYMKPTLMPDNTGWHSDKHIIYGLNLSDMEINTTTDDFYTVLLATGTVTTSNQPDTDAQDTTSQSQSSTPVLRIIPVFYKNSTVRLQYDYGIIVKTVDFGDMPYDDLSARGERYIQDHYPFTILPQQFSVKAFDLSFVDPSQKIIFPGDKVFIENPKLKDDSFKRENSTVNIMTNDDAPFKTYQDLLIQHPLYCVSAEYDLSNLANTTYSFDDPIQETSDPPTENNTKSSATSTKASQSSNRSKKRAKKTKTPTPTATGSNNGNWIQNLLSMFGIDASNSNWDQVRSAINNGEWGKIPSLLPGVFNISIGGADGATSLGSVVGGMINGGVTAISSALTGLTGGGISGIMSTINGNLDTVAGTVNDLVSDVGQNTDLVKAVGEGLGVSGDSWVDLDQKGLVIAFQDESKKLKASVTIHTDLIQSQLESYAGTSLTAQAITKAYQIYASGEDVVFNDKGQFEATTRGGGIWSSIEQSTTFFGRNVKVQKVQETDQNGNPKTDADGNPVYKRATDADGNPMTDADNNPVYVEAITLSKGTLFRKTEKGGFIQYIDNGNLMSSIKVDGTGVKIQGDKLTIDTSSIIAKVTNDIDLETVAGNINLEALAGEVAVKADLITNVAKKIDLKAVGTNVTLDEQGLKVVAENVNLTAENITAIAEKVSFTTKQLEVIADNVDLSSQYVRIDANVGVVLDSSFQVSQGKNVSLAQKISINNQKNDGIVLSDVLTLHTQHGFRFGNGSAIKGIGTGLTIDTKTSTLKVSGLSTVQVPVVTSFTQASTEGGQASTTNRTLVYTDSYQETTWTDSHDWK